MPFFSPKSLAKVRADDRYDANRKYLEHQAAAEHHQALADMFRNRVARLDREDDDKPQVEIVDAPRVAGLRRQA